MIHAANVRQGPGSIELPRSRAPVVEGERPALCAFRTP